ncbi:MAG: hypothetical protein U5K43_04040 [Halofilum sp. (in: g-proteobacteria)]|nr:hypothetical protein [Halofilum sp. (in: g-proteobacteria)]
MRHDSARRFRVADQKIETQLNALAAEGWQVVFQVLEQKRFWLFWKRGGDDRDAGALRMQRLVLAAIARYRATGGGLRWFGVDCNFRAELLGVRRASHRPLRLAPGPRTCVRSNTCMPAARQPGQVPRSGAEGN